MFLIYMIQGWGRNILARPNAFPVITGGLPSKVPCFDFPPRLQTLVSLLDDLSQSNAPHTTSSVETWLRNLDLADLSAELDGMPNELLESAQCVAHWIQLVLVGQGLDLPEKLAQITETLHHRSGVKTCYIQFLYNWKHPVLAPGSCYSAANLDVMSLEMRFPLSSDSEASASLWHMSQLALELERSSGPMLEALISAGAAAKAANEWQLQKDLHTVLAVLHGVIASTKLLMRSDLIKSEHWPFVSSIASGATGGMNFWIFTLDLMLGMPGDSHETLNDFRHDLSYHTKRQETLMRMLKVACPLLRSYLQHGATSQTHMFWTSIHDLALVWRAAHYRRVIQIISGGKQAVKQNHVDSLHSIAELFERRIRQLAEARL